MLTDQNQTYWPSFVSQPYPHYVKELKIDVRLSPAPKLLYFKKDVYFCRHTLPKRIGT